MLSFYSLRDEQSVLQKFVAGLDNALMGYAPELTSNVPDFMTKEKTLEVVGKLNKVERESLREYLNAALDKDPSFWSNQLNVTRFFCAARVNLKFSDEK